MAAYRLWVNEGSTIKVEWWPDGVGDGREVMAVATRETPGDMWGPPIELSEEQM